MKLSISYGPAIVLVFIASGISGRTLEIKGSCICAAIEYDGLAPILQHTLPQFNVSCNEEGTNQCEGLCISLALAAKDKGANAICQNSKGDIDNMHVRLYTKICNENIWKFSGVELPNPICCHEGRATQCGF